jgi:3'(2'), 5'-bisphosphate nucleotidase
MKHLDQAIHAAQLACTEILKVYNSPNFEIESKGDQSPLTLADRKAHDMIVEILKPTGLPILSEEGKSIPYATRKDWPAFWMVDPLDGTKEFIKRNGEFTVNIALIENQQPTLGVVAVPVTGELYYGAEGKAFKITNGQTVELKRPSAIDMTKPGIRVVASRSHLNEETQQFIDSLANPQLVSKGSSLKFMMLADGEADIYPRFAPTMEWDTAAAHAVVNQLGFKVLEKDTTQELRYNKENLLNPYFLVR